MIRVAIVEDDIICAQLLEEYLHQYAKEHGKEFRITHFQDGADIAEDYHPVYDVILMDIEMTFMNGMTAAEKIRKSDNEVIIIFITNIVQYAVRGYLVNALDYLVKPVSFFSFEHCMGRAMDRMRQKKKHYLIVKNKGDFRKIAIDEIYYLESRGHDILVHTMDDTMLMSGTMKEMESKLEPHHFCRCNKGYLVNFAHVNAMIDGMVVVGEDHLIISRPRKKIFQEKMATYLNEILQ